MCFVKLLAQAESAGGQLSERPLQKTKCLTSPLSTASQTPLQLPIPPDEHLVLVSLFLPLSPLICQKLQSSMSRSVRIVQSVLDIYLAKAYQPVLEGKGLIMIPRSRNVRGL